MAGRGPLDAERKAGQILAQMRESGERAANRNGQESESPPATLNDIGVTKSQSSRWQKLATLPEALAARHRAPSRFSGAGPSHMRHGKAVALAIDRD